MSILGAAFSLFVVYNMLGRISIYITLLRPFSPQRQRRILAREMTIALTVLLVFGFFGEAVLQFLGITHEIIGVAGGVILFLLALDMLFPQQEERDALLSEPLVIPLAIPMMAGPGSITATMVYADQLQVPWKIISFILLAWIPALGIALLAPTLRKYLGDKSLSALVRLGGFLLCFISVKMIALGIIQFIKLQF